MTATITRPHNARPEHTGALVDVGTGDVVVFGSWKRDGSDRGARNAWVMRWNTGTQQVTRWRFFAEQAAR